MSFTPPPDRHTHTLETCRSTCHRLSKKGNHGLNNLPETKNVYQVFGLLEFDLTMFFR